MKHPGFFERAGPFALRDIAAAAGAEIGAAGGDPDLEISDVLPLADAGAEHLTFLDNRKYIPQLAGTRAAACLVAPALADRVPTGTTALVMAAPYHGFARSLQLFYPDAMRPKAARWEAPIAAADGKDTGGGLIHPSAAIEDGAKVEVGAVIGREAVIGRGSQIAAGAVIGYRVHVGRDCYIGPGASVIHALLGDRVVLHSGVRIGQDGFGFAMGPDGHIKVPQIGRVIIQDDVEIGANSCVDRGALKDTVIGEGTKIDDLVMIAHNVRIGRHCVIVAQAGVAGSATLGDFVVLGGCVAVIGHVNVGAGAMIAGSSGVTKDVPPGAKMGGLPAKPFKQWAREIAALSKLAGKDGGEKRGSN